MSYVATAAGLKENIVLYHAPRAAPSYVYTIDTSDDLTPVMSAAGSIDFERNGSTVISIPAGIMADSADIPAESTAVDYVLSGAGAAWSLKVTPDMAWLSDPTRVYPVTVDPSLTNQPDSRDCWIGADAPTISRCGTQADHIRVGRESAGERKRGLFDFDIASIPDTATVGSATISLYLDSSRTYSALSADYAFYPAGKVWDGGATWNSAGANGDWTGGDPGGTAYGTKTIKGDNAGYKDFFGMGDLFQKWVSGTAAHRGLVLKQVGENTNNVLQFYSASSLDSNNGKRPYLNLTYSLPTVDPEASDDEGAGTELLSVTPTSTDPTQTVTDSQTTTIPGCTATADNDCSMTLSVTEDPETALVDDQAMSAVEAGVDGGLLSERTTLSGRQYCLPTGCYKKVLAKSWVQHLCFVACSANQATHKGVFYRTPDGKYVWETVEHGGVKGWHTCQVDHTIGVGLEPGKDNYCTAPRYGNSSIHSHYWIKMTAVWVASELFLGSARHYGDGTTSYKVYSY